MTAHWGIPDPALIEGNEVTRMMAFRKALSSLESRISMFVSLPIESLDRLKLQAKLNEIGKTGDDDAGKPADKGA